jgi:hypothetical protein
MKKLYKTNAHDPRLTIRLLMVLILISSSPLIAQKLNGKLAYSHVILHKNEMVVHNPTNEFISPSVITATDHLTNPLGKYYLYYAPHDAPGGICLAYSNSLEGPYTEYSGNPILTNKHQGKIDVSHVSSPYVMWMPQYNKYFLYFHGENTVTRWASSTNGINWDLANDNISLRTADWGSAFTECSYAKVYEYTVPGIGNRYIMVMMLIRSGFGRRIGFATSNDGKKFTPRDEALVSQAGEGSDIASPAYWYNDGRHYILYHSNLGSIYRTEVGSDFSLENHLGAFYTPGSSFPEYSKAAAPFMVYENNRWNMFYMVGQRLHETIGFAYEVTSHDIIVDNANVDFTSGGGTWLGSTASEGSYGSNYLNDNGSGSNTGMWAKWKPTIPQSGYYKVMARWTTNANRPDNIKYKVYSQGVVTEVRRNQQRQNGSWVELGRFYFTAGNSENNKLTLDAGSDAGYAIADAARFVFDGTSAARSSSEENESMSSITFSDDEHSDSYAFPNPTRGRLNILTQERNLESEISITNTSGVVVSRYRSSNNGIDVSALPPGFYILSYKANEGVVKLRFSKE